MSAQQTQISVIIIQKVKNLVADLVCTFIWQTHETNSQYDNNLQNESFNQQIKNTLVNELRIDTSKKPHFSAILETAQPNKTFENLKSILEHHFPDIQNIETKVGYHRTHQSIDTHNLHLELT